MEFSKDGVSIYQRFQAFFIRNLQGELLYCKGPLEKKIDDDWAAVKAHLCHDETGEKCPNSQFRSARICQNYTGSVIYEMRRPGEDQVTGIVLSAEAEEPTPQPEFEGFFANLLLDQVNLAIPRPDPSAATPSVDDAVQMTEKIVDLFERRLRYIAKDDKWEAVGRAYFSDRVRHFTSRRARLEFCLPAFPCKSSNLNKVASKEPDRGEELALTNLHRFVEEVEGIYEPGAKVWIISDGHVFSDCIGVDDVDVDEYGKKLKEMNCAIGQRQGRTDRVDFKSLVDILELGKSASEAGLSNLGDQLHIANIDHHIATQVTQMAELSRRILMAGCQSDRSAVRAKIQSQDAALLALYRGFSRFMLDDLEMHPAAQSMSRSKQRKLSIKVSFEMIMRNQAYSNLVELVFPNHIRLSIHAHNNAGPKFGIQLFDPSLVRATKSLSADAALMTSYDMLHVPTPWHNCVVELSGSSILRVTKSKVARESLASGDLEGRFVEGEVGRGAYFLMCQRSEEEAEVKDLESIPPQAGQVSTLVEGGELKERGTMIARLASFLRSVFLICRRLLGLQLDA